MSEKVERLFLCAACGAAHMMDAYIDEKDKLVNYEYPRECKSCKELKAYMIIPLSNYAVNIIGLLNRVRKLEKRVKKLEEEP